MIFPLCWCHFFNRHLWVGSLAPSQAQKGLQSCGWRCVRQREGAYSQGAKTTIFLYSTDTFVITCHHLSDFIRIKICVQPSLA